MSASKVEYCLLKLKYSILTDACDRHVYRVNKRGIAGDPLANLSRLVVV